MENKQLKCLCALALTVGISSKLNDHVVLANPNGSNEVSSSNLASGVVTADALNVRSDASTSSRIIGVLHKDSKVTILESRNGWHKVKINSGEGWIFGEYVKIQGGSQVASSQLGEVNANSLNVRSGAGTSHGIIGSLSQGASVNIVGSADGWYKINYNGTIGFVSGDYVTVKTGDGSSRPSRGDGDTPSTQEKPGTVNVASLNVRNGAGTNYDRLASLSQGQVVKVFGESNGWYKISINGIEGFVSKEFITIDGESNTTPTTPTTPPIDNTTPNTFGKVAVVNTDALNLRDGAGGNYTKVGTVRYGDKLPIQAHSNGWYKVSFGNVIGWVSGEYVKVISESEANTPKVRETPLISSNYSGEDIVNKSLEYLGVPYVWGGFTPVGFDCSGLVQYVYRQLGIELERTTFYQVHQGVTVSRDELKPGDLLFFTTDDDNPSSISHVGIYKGNDLFVQAPKAGDVVRVSNLNSAYYSNRYYIAKRIIK